MLETYPFPQLHWLIVDAFPLLTRVLFCSSTLLRLENICFLLKDEKLNADFLKFAEEAGCVGLAGHRSAGGFRASTYNALELESVQVLVDVMKEFERING